MFPISDSNPRLRTPVITWVMIGACVAVFLYQLGLPSMQAQQAFIYSYGMIPASLFGYVTLPSELERIPAEATVISSMFLHGGLLHLGGNMLYLWIFGDNVEDAMGPVSFILFYLVCGVIAALTQAFLSPESQIPMVGASGAISGVLGAYLFLFPTARVNVLIFFGVITVLPVPAMVVLGFWFMIQLFSGLMTPPGEPGVAFWAHIGGFVAGVALYRVFGARPRRLEKDRHGRGPWD